MEGAGDWSGGRKSSGRPESLAVFQMIFTFLPGFQKGLCTCAASGWVIFLTHSWPFRLVSTKKEDLSDVRQCLISPRQQKEGNKDEFRKQQMWVWKVVIPTGGCEVAASSRGVAFGDCGTKDDNNNDGNQWQMPALGDREEPEASRGTHHLGGARADSTAGLEGSADK